MGAELGITIHFEGRVRNGEALEQLIRQVSEFAARHNWPTHRLAESERTLHRVIDEESIVYTGPTRGIVVQPHPNSEPINLEFDSEFFIQDYCKTQFAGIDTHIAVIALLREIEQLFSELTVHDEGEFWETRDEQRLQYHIDTVAAILAEHLRQKPQAQGPVRINGRIVDFVGG